MRKPLSSKKTRCSVNCLKEVYNAAHYHLPTFTMSGNNINSVFYAELYHPIQAGSIDGTDIHPHDNAICRALLCSSAGLCMCFYFLYSFPPPTPNPPAAKQLFKYSQFLPILYLNHLADDPVGDPKAIGDPYCTVFVGRLSHFTSEDTLRKVSGFFFFFKFPLIFSSYAVLQNCIHFGLN